MWERLTLIESWGCSECGRWFPAGVQQSCYINGDRECCEYCFMRVTVGAGKGQQLPLSQLQARQSVLACRILQQRLPGQFQDLIDMAKAKGSTYERFLINGQPRQLLALQGYINLLDFWQCVAGLVPPDEVPAKLIYQLVLIQEAL